jgi:hypothetical protein
MSLSKISSAEDLAIAGAGYEGSSDVGGHQEQSTLSNTQAVPVTPSATESEAGSEHAAESEAGSENAAESEAASKVAAESDASSSSESDVSHYDHPEQYKLGNKNYKLEDGPYIRNKGWEMHGVQLGGLSDRKLYGKDRSLQPSSWTMFGPTRKHGSRLDKGGAFEWQQPSEEVQNSSGEEEEGEDADDEDEGEEGEDEEGEGEGDAGEGDAGEEDEHMEMY